MDIREFEEGDWRGILAIASYILVLIALIFRPDALGEVGILATIATQWYFEGKRKDGNV
jgi:hypothetical protein